MKINIAILFFILCYVGFTAYGQTNLETRLEFKKNVKFQFTDEWQYLTTDIYFFNGDKLDEVINKIDDIKKRKKRDEYFEQLLVTAKISDVKLAKSDLVYPLYNFQYTIDQNKGYTSTAGKTTEAIRLIDKLPLANNVDAISADIEVKAITNKQENEIIKFVGTQLMTISSIVNPAATIMALVGEYGKFMDSRSKKSEYKFASTIRLYEGQNFDIRLHSIRIYVIIPGGAPTYFYTDDLIKFMDAKDNPEIDRKLLEGLIGNKIYPYLVVVNYKSLYKMDVVTGDQVNLETIEKRKQKVEQAKELGLIKPEPYRQEKYYIEFLTIFNELKNSLNLYSLNYEIGNTEAISKNIFVIIQNYNRLKTIYSTRIKELKDNSVFQSLFKQEYEAILGYADLYLEKDANLKNTKEMVNTLLTLKNKAVSNLSTDEKELNIKKLNSITLPNAEFLANSIEGQSILKLINELEKDLMDDVYTPECNQLRNTPANQSTLPVRNKLQMKVNSTGCKACREKAQSAIDQYNERYELYEVNKRIEKKDSLVRVAEGKILDYFEKKDCIAKKMRDSSLVASLGSSKEYIVKKVAENVENIENLEQMLSAKQSYNKLIKLNEFMDDITLRMKRIEEGFENICNKYKELCNCGK